MLWFGYSARLQRTSMFFGSWIQLLRCDWLVKVLTSSGDWSLMGSHFHNMPGRWWKSLDMRSSWGKWITESMSLLASSSPRSSSCSYSAPSSPLHVPSCLLLCPYCPSWCRFFFSPACCRHEIHYFFRLKAMTLADCGLKSPEPGTKISSFSPFGFVCFVGDRYHIP